MSHDRGCPCGREPYEYDDCDLPIADCFKKENKMIDNDWRPSACPHCGKLRAAARNPICTNTRCKSFIKSNQSMVKQKPRYVCIKASGEAIAVDDAIDFWNSPDFDSAADSIYRLGDEIEISVSINAKKTYRSAHGD